MVSGSLIKSRPPITNPDEIILNKHVGVKQLELLTYNQKVSVAEAIRILEDNYQVNILTGAGGGKTRKILMLAKHFGIPIFGVMKDNAKRAFLEENKKIGARIIDFVSYRKLSSTFKDTEDDYRVLNNGYLMARDYYKEKQTKNGVERIQKTKFLPTRKLINMVKKGVLVVFDEAHNIKNDNRGNKAAMTVIKTIMMGSPSRFAFLTATLLNNIKQSERYVRNMGIVTRSKLFRSEGKEVIFDNSGMEELIDYCMDVDPETTERILETHENPKTRKQINAMIFNFICEIITPYLGTKSNVVRKLVPCTMFLYIEDPVRREMIEALSEDMKEQYNQLAAANPGKALPLQDRVVFNESLQKINELMIPDVVRYVKCILDKDPGAKVLIFCRRNAIRRKYLKLLKKYGVTSIHGGDGQKEKVQTESARTEEIKKFTAKDTKYRVMCLNYAAGAESSNLQSRSKKQTMHTILSMDQDTKDMIQASYRTDRFSPTTPYVYMAAPYISNSVPDIIDSTAKKDAITTLVNKKDEDYLYPGQYPPKIEDASETKVKVDGYPEIDNSHFIKFDKNYGLSLLRGDYKLDFINLGEPDAAMAAAASPKKELSKKILVSESSESDSDKRPKRTTDFDSSESSGIVC